MRDWKTFRPAIWLAMLGIALLLVVNVYLGLAVVGAGIGTGLRIQTRRRRLRRPGGGDAGARPRRAIASRLVSMSTTSRGPAGGAQPFAGDIAIAVRGLAKSYGAVRALGGVDLDVPSGTVLGLLGPNGAGKTTLVRILTTLLEPDAGSATVVGLDVVREASALRHRIG